MNKKAIIVVSFGTTYPQTRKQNLWATQQAIQTAFPEYQTYNAYTSQVVINRVAQQENIQMHTPREVLIQLVQQQVTEVIIQPLHIIPGWEFNSLKTLVQEFQDQFNQLRLGEPLLVKIKDFQRLITFIKDQAASLAPNEANLWMGHGSSHSSFTEYACLDHMLWQTNSFVGAVESYPEITVELPRMQQQHIARVYLHPLMMVAGNHAHHDMAAATANSWQTILEQHQIAVVPVLKGLGQYPEIQAMFIDKIKALLQ